MNGKVQHFQTRAVVNIRPITGPLKVDIGIPLVV